MKILLVHNHYQQYGGERVAVESPLSLLRERGNNVVLYSRDNAEIDDYGLWQKAEFLPETVFSLRTWHEIKALVAKEHLDGSPTFL